MQANIRWMIRRDLVDVVEISGASFSPAWTEEEFLAALRQRNCIGMVAEFQEGNRYAITGYMIYELHKHRLELLNLAVHPDFRELGVGRKMIDRLKEKLHANRRQSIALDIPDDNLDGQLFLKALGFTGVPTENPELYRMEFHIDPPKWKNRVAQYMHRGPL